MHFRFNSSDELVESDLNASTIGLNPVHLQMFPSNEYSTSAGVNFGLDNAILCIFIMKPGVQNPH